MRTLLEIVLLLYPDFRVLFDWLKGVDWSGFGWAFAGSTIAMIKTPRRSWPEGFFMLAVGILASMAFTPDIVARTGFNQNAVSFLVGLGGWGLAGFFVKAAKDPIKAYKQVKKDDIDLGDGN